jgi:hypothetical protein
LSVAARPAQAVLAAFWRPSCRRSDDSGGIQALDGDALGELVAILAA